MIYVHLPYCASKCAYCDFYSTPERGTMTQYVSALLAEARLRRDELPQQPVATLYLGGGTPSVVPIALLGELVCGLRRIFDLSQLQEFTVEVNPDDITPGYVASLAELGVNRVSMGVQSFHDTELGMVGRRHTAAQAVDALQVIRDGGIGNVSIDLIYALPGQSLADWEDNLKQSIALSPNHISAYCLSYEPRTRLWAMREKGTVAEADDELCLAMFEALTKELTAAGYEHYEISNFAKPGCRSRHNSRYWQGVPYLGLGAAAHSFNGEARSYNPANVKEYIDKVMNGAKACAEERLQWWERYDEDVMVRLRTCEGIDLQRIETLFGTRALSYLKKQAMPHIAAGNVIDSDNHIRLTHSGIMISDAIISDLMWEEV